MNKGADLGVFPQAAGVLHVISNPNETCALHPRQNLIGNLACRYLMNTYGTNKTLWGRLTLLDISENLIRSFQRNDWEDSQGHCSTHCWKQSTLAEINTHGPWQIAATTSAPSVPLQAELQPQWQISFCNHCGRLQPG